MANLEVKDGSGATKYIKSVGAGSDGDPQINHVVICDVGGNPVAVDSGAINIHHVDVHGVPVNVNAHKLSGVSSTLSSAAAVGDTSVVLVSATGFVVGDYVVLNTHESFAVITAISTNTITLDRQLDMALSSGVSVAVVDFDMAVSGTLSSPLTFKIEPPADEIWHILRVIFTMTHSVAGDLAKFGGITGLTNGVQIVSSVGGVEQNISNWKTNGQIKSDIFDLEFTDKAGGSGANGTSGRYTFSKLGVAIKLDGSTGDSLDFMVQDDLTALASFEFKAQGHIVGQ